MERHGLHLQVKERHWLTVVIGIQTAGAECLDCTQLAPYLYSVPHPLSWFQVKITLGLGWVFLPFFFKLKVERKGLP